MEKLYINNEEISYKRINCNSNGHPRYVFHFLDLGFSMEEYLNGEYKKYHLQKYRGDDVGGGLVLTTFNLKEDVIKILNREV